MAESDKLIRNEAEAIECLKSNKPTSGYVMLRESIDMAINALEKQIAKKPIPLIDKIFGIAYSFMCPCCNYEGLGGNECRFARCENCGQKLDWSDAN